jgi:hypothetical protein
MEPMRPTPWLWPRTLPAVNASGAATSTRSPRLITEGQSITARESEPPIVATKSGNADGAKGRRHSTVSHGTTCQTLSWENT